MKQAEGERGLNCLSQTPSHRGLRLSVHRLKHSHWGLQTHSHRGLNSQATDPFKQGVSALSFRRNHTGGLNSQSIDRHIQKGGFNYQSIDAFTQAPHGQTGTQNTQQRQKIVWNNKIKM